MDTEPRLDARPRSTYASVRPKASITTVTIVCWSLSASIMSYLIFLCEFGRNLLSSFLFSTAYRQIDIKAYNL